ncbi:MAG: putative pyridine nucleotide-disulfide oxidoreductase [Solirubrobacterales bacterium]|nr:putative pyridine nucleotide-disulfide oxidoreductase [Solirubrobacterales bacterium]
MSSQEHDVIVLGAGPAGEVAAGRLADAGLQVALVEKHLVGGECSFYGCMPSKGLLRPGQALAEARRIPGAAEAVSGSVDAAAVLARRDEIVHGLDDGEQLPWVQDKGIALVRGTGRLDGERTVVVDDGTRLIARRAVLVAVGSRAAMPPIEGLADAVPWTNREITNAHEVPASLLVIGGGPIGTEMAQAWRSLGSEVTILEGSERLLVKEEPFASEQVQDAMAELGVSVRTGVKVARVERDGTSGPVTVELGTGERLTAAELVVAAGRHVPLEELGLETIGVAPDDHGHLAVDDTMRVPGHDWLFAVGDANGRALLTHMGKYQARLAADEILGKPTELLIDRGRSPRVTFTEPQVAAVGYTLAGALDAGIRARAVEVGTSANAGGSFYGRGAVGTARLVIDEDRGLVVGATITGAEIADFLQAATIAVVGEVPLTRLWHAVPVFPTRSELWLQLLEKAGF